MCILFGTDGAIETRLALYIYVIMGAMASQITSVSIVYSTVCSGADQRKTSKLRVTGLCEGNSPMTGEFPSQRASNAENVSIWGRHHVEIWIYSAVPLCAVNFLENPHKRHHIARPLGRGWCVFVGSQSNLYSASGTAVMYAISWHIGQCHYGTWLYYLSI